MHLGRWRKMASVLKQTERQWWSSPLYIHTKKNKRAPLTVKSILLMSSCLWQQSLYWQCSIRGLPPGSKVRPQQSIEGLFRLLYLNLKQPSRLVHQAVACLSYFSSCFVFYSGHTKPASGCPRPFTDSKEWSCWEDLTGRCEPRWEDTMQEKAATRALPSIHQPYPAGWWKSTEPNQTCIV